MDRKARIREYKETPRTAGIGAIRNRADGRLLLVSSADLPAAFNRHRAQLRFRSHQNRALQADWNELGAEAFEFVTLDTLERKDAPDDDPTDDLRTLEALWLEKLGPFEPAGYHRRKP